MAVINQEVNDRYAIYNGDCMEVLPQVKDDSVGMSVYSPPFPELYQYSNDPRDMSNCAKYSEGMDQFAFVINEIHRVTMPGRITCVHCMDLKKGSYTQRDFPGDIVRLHEAAGFHFMCRITIWKDPWLIARRTRVRSLQHKSIVTGNFKVRVAGPDYVLVFVKGGQETSPIKHPTGLQSYAGETPIPETFFDGQGRAHPASEYVDYTGDQRKNLRSHWIWRNYASPVWMDIRSGRLLPYADSKETDEEKHVCPLQLDVIERCITLWSNPGDVVLTPFMGVGSEAYMATLMGRKALGVELKTTYYNQAVKNVASALDGVPCEQNVIDFGDPIPDEDDEVEVPA